MDDPARLRIVVIDDDPFASKLIAQQLGNLGCEGVRTFLRARDALSHLADVHGEADVVFCDLEMPEMDGVEFVRNLAATPFGGGLVLISGEDTRILQAAERLARDHRLRVLGALAKPILPATLAAVLARQLDDPTVPRGQRKTYSADELRRAIRDQELFCDYQPIVEVRSGRLSAVETLVRWQHPDDGVVFPDQFIGTAEEHGLIDALAGLVLGLALRQCREWEDSGLNPQVSVNVSMDNLGTLRFPDMVAEMVAAAGISATRLTLEVTESRLMKDRISALDILIRLRLRKVGLSIDDFGTGHSSLVQLRDVPFDELKIDRTFVHGACRDASLRAIFSANVAMAEQLRMRVVAEGVEDADDWAFLRAMRCTHAQGWFIARPMRPQALAAWLDCWKVRHAALTQHDDPEGA